MHSMPMLHMCNRCPVPLGAQELVLRFYEGRQFKFAAAQCGLQSPKRSMHPKFRKNFDGCFPMKRGMVRHEPLLPTNISTCRASTQRALEVLAPLNPPSSCHCSMGSVCRLLQCSHPRLCSQGTSRDLNTGRVSGQSVRRLWMRPEC